VMSMHLATTSDIVGWKDFENGMVKLLRNENLSKKEKLDCTGLEVIGAEADASKGDAVEEELDYAQTLIKNFSAKKLPATSAYVMPDFIPCTSALVESFFSVSRRAFPYSRACMKS